MKFHPIMQTKVQSSDPSGIPSDLSQVDARDSIISYEISRYEVENGLTKRLVHDLRTDPANPLLHAGPGAIVFWVSGYDEDPREMVQIPDFQKFVHKLDRSNLCWIYFADPESYWPQIVAFCTAYNPQVVCREDQPTCTLLLSATDVATFLERQADQYGQLCSWAHISEQEASRKLKAVFRCFGHERR
ncbi:hypothetical protein BH09VER1_BH09VER1_17850 [soil metagenome]